MCVDIMSRGEVKTIEVKCEVEELVASSYLDHVLEGVARWGFLPEWLREKIKSFVNYKHQVTVVYKQVPIVVRWNGDVEQL